MSVKEILNTRVKVLVQRSVSNQTRLGKIRSWSILAIAGNRDGWLGLGMAKSTEPTIATDKAKQLAIRNMRPIPRYENRTIYGNVGGQVRRNYCSTLFSPARLVFFFFPSSKYTLVF